MLFETYGMIVPEPNSCKNYELFYTFYSLNIKQNLISNQLLKESKSQLPIMNLGIKESINHKFDEIDVTLSEMDMFGSIKRIKTEREAYSISIQSNDLQIKDKYFENDYNKFIDYVTDFQQVIILYSSFENTIKNWLDEPSSQSQLLNNIIQKENKFIEKFNNLHSRNFTKEDFHNIWKYFTFIRSLYTHSSGVIDQKFIKDMKRVHLKIIDMINRNFNFFERSLFPDNYEILRTENFEENDLFVITEIELRFFRNFIIYTWETIYLLSYNLTKKIDYQHNIKFELVANELEFREFKTYDESQTLNNMPTFLTDKISNFYISTYLCPNCTREHIFLYKTLYQPNISLQEITNEDKHEDIKIERVFTCPNCQSFFISKYKERLSDNNGVNIIINFLEYDEYLIVLEKFNMKGTAYMPQEDMENMAQHTTIHQLEKIVVEAKKNSARLKE